jgi:hypothetical protein
VGPTISPTTPKTSAMKLLQTKKNAFGLELDQARRARGIGASDLPEAREAFGTAWRLLFGGEPPPMIGG